MSEHFPLMVPGAEPAAEPAVVRSPFDGSPIATVEQVDQAGAERALATADALFRNRDAWLSPARRIEILRRAAAIMQERREQLALEAAREGGKPLVDSLVEADRAVDSIRLCAEHLRRQAGGEIPMDRNAASAGRLAFTHHEPIGVVLAFSAFNHPLNLIAHQVGPAVAAGCPVIVKPAKATPLSLLPAGADSARSRPARGVVPAAGDRRPGPGPRRWSPIRGWASSASSAAARWAGRLRSRLAAGRAVLAGAWRRGAGDRGRRRRSGRCPAAVVQGRFLSRRAGLRVGAAGVCRPADRPHVGRAAGRGGRGAEGGRPDAAGHGRGPADPREGSRPRRRVGAGGRRARGGAAVRRPAEVGQVQRPSGPSPANRPVPCSADLLRPDRALRPARPTRG